jgi:pyruvate dehydrogenase E2 component (dihydrolipoamide acetyltransferase)
MPIIPILIPQLGEGLQEALLVEFLKKPGDKVRRDEPIYVMETDKATTDVESPYDGTLVEWTVETGSVLAIGTEIAKMEVAEGTQLMTAGHGPSSDETELPEVSVASEDGDEEDSRGSARETEAGVKIPPRTRKYLKDKGLLAVAEKIPAVGNKLMPEDVDRFIASGGVEAMSIPGVDSEKYDVVPLSRHQLTLNYRMTRSAQQTIPVTVQTEVNWTAIEAARAETRQAGGPTSFVMSLWCVVEALKKHPKLRSSLAADGKHLNQYKHTNLGIAVSLPDDVLVTAVVRDADVLQQASFFEACTHQIELARNGKDQADQSTTLTVSNIGKVGMRMGIPAIVAPAVATLAMGEAYWQPVPDANGSGYRFQSAVTFTLTFDHRILNGVGAANFMNDLKQLCENFKLTS